MTDEEYKLIINELNENFRLIHKANKTLKEMQRMQELMDKLEKIENEGE